MLELVAPRFDWSAVVLAIAAAALTREPAAVVVSAAPTQATVIEQPRTVAAPACERATRAQSFFEPLPAGPRSYELHHLDRLGYVDLDCDGVIDSMFRHVAATGPELVISSYLHRQRFYDYRIPLGTGACEASVDIDERTVEVVVTRRCDARVERYAIRESRLYLDGRFVRDGQ